MASITAAAGEALTNAAEHVEASRVVVSAEVDNDHIFVTVGDDDCRFDPICSARFGGGQLGVDNTLENASIRWCIRR